MFWKMFINIFEQKTSKLVENNKITYTQPQTAFQKTQIQRNIYLYPWIQQDICLYYQIYHLGRIKMMKY